MRTPQHAAGSTRLLELSRLRVRAWHVSQAVMLTAVAGVPLFIRERAVSANGIGRSVPAVNPSRRRARRHEFGAGDRYLSAAVHQVGVVVEVSVE